MVYSSYPSLCYYFFKFLVIIILEVAFKVADHSLQVKVIPSVHSM